MVRKRKKHEEEKPWCFYCDREFNDENDLILHQKNKHFKCNVCNKRLSTAKALTVHSLQVHKVTVHGIPDAKDGRDDPTWDIFGSAGIPPGMKRGQDPPKPGAALEPAPGGGPHMHLPMQGGGPPPYGMPPPRPYGGGPPLTRPYYGVPRPGGPYGMPPPPGQHPYPGAPPPYGMPPPPHPFFPPRPGYPPGGMPGMPPPYRPGMPPPPMHMPPYLAPPPPPGMPHAYHPGMPPHTHGGPGRPMPPFPGGVPPPGGAPLPYPVAGGPAAAAAPTTNPAAAGQDGVELIWADEEVSMEERRAALPRYSERSPARSQQA